MKGDVPDGELDPSTAMELYFGEGLEQTKIGGMYGLSKEQVMYRLKKTPEYPTIKSGTARRVIYHGRVPVGEVNIHPDVRRRWGIIKDGEYYVCDPTVLHDAELQDVLYENPHFPYDRERGNVAETPPEKFQQKSGPEPDPTEITAETAEELTARRAFEEYFGEGMRVAEIADAYGTNSSAVSQLLNETPDYPRVRSPDVRRLLYHKALPEDIELVEETRRKYGIAKKDGVTFIDPVLIPDGELRTTVYENPFFPFRKSG